MANNTINLKSPSSFTSGFLIGDEVPYPGGSVDSVPTLTLVNGEPVSAALEIQSLLGSVLIPRMTTAAMNLLTACDGMMVYNTDAASPDFYFHVGGSWVAVTTGTAHGVTSISAGANIVLTPNPIITTGTVALATTLTGITSISSAMGNTLTLETGGVAAITIGLTQNVAFAKDIFLNSNNSANGLFSFTAATASGGVFFDSAAGNIRFTGVNPSSVWAVYDSNGLAILQVLNKGTAGPITINNGTLSVYDNISSGSAGTNAGSLTLKSLGGGSITHNVQSTATTYTLSWPTSLPPFTGYILSSDNTGALSWVPNPEDVGGRSNSLAYFNSFGELASNANSNVDSSGDISTNGTFQATGSITSGNGSTTGSFVIDSASGGSVTHTVQGTALNYIMNWPTSEPPFSGYILSSSSIGVLAWVANPQLGGTANTLAYYNSGGTLASNTNVTVHAAGDITTTSTIQAGNITLTGSNVNSSGSLIFGTNGSSTALTLDTTTNATFAASVYLNNSFVLNLGHNATGGSTFTPSIILNSSTTNYMQLGANFGAGSIHLIETVGSFPFEIQSGNVLELLTNGGTLAVTIDTSQNATFTQDIIMSANSTVKGLLSSTALSGTGGVYFDSSAGNLRFSGGSSSNTWGLFDSSGMQILYAFNLGSSTKVIGIDAGSLLLQTSGGAIGHTAPSSMAGSYTLTWPAAAATITGQGLTSSTGGTLSWTNVALNGGNTLGAALTLGTTDSNSFILETNSITALTLDTSQNATFAGNVSLINSNNIILGSNHGAATTFTPEIQLFYKDALSSTIQQLSTGLAITSVPAPNSNITFNSGRGINFNVNGTNAALTLNSAQDAHFTASVEADGFITSGIAGTQTGTFVLNNAGGGNLSFSVASSASIYTITYPASAPTNAGFLNVLSGGSTNWVTGRCSFQSNTTQTISNTTVTAVNFANTIFNLGSLITVSSNNTFTVSSSGTVYLLITYVIFWQNLNTFPRDVASWIFVNGAGFQYAFSSADISGGSRTTTGTAIVALSNTDDFQVLVEQSSGGDGTIGTGGTTNQNQLYVWQLA